MLGMKGHLRIRVFGYRGRRAAGSGGGGGSMSRGLTAISYMYTGSCDQSDPRLHPVDSPRSPDSSRTNVIFLNPLPMMHERQAGHFRFRREACNITRGSDPEYLWHPLSLDRCRRELTNSTSQRERRTSLSPCTLRPPLASQPHL